MLGSWSRTEEPSSISWVVIWSPQSHGCNSCCRIISLAERAVEAKIARTTARMLSLRRGGTYIYSDSARACSTRWEKVALFPSSGHATWNGWRSVMIGSQMIVRIHYRAWAHSATDHPLYLDSQGERPTL